MKTIVFYPLKTLVGTYMPEECEVLTAETEDEFFQLSARYLPEAVVLFSEMFSRPAWEWIPKVVASLPTKIPIVIIPIHKDEVFIKRIVEEAGLPNIYMLSANLSYQDIRSHLTNIFGGSNPPLLTVKTQVEQQRNGKIFSLMSYGTAGITTFCINYPILLGKRYSDKLIAVVDMNAVKPDLSNFFKLHQHQLAIYRPELIDLKQAVKRNWVSLFKRSQYSPNVYYASANNQWKSYEISNLVTVLRGSFDFIYIDWGYCFPESEALQRLLHEADENLFFARADPFSIESAAHWIHKWEEKKISNQLIVSHFDRNHMSVRQITEGLPIYGIVPRISDSRVIQSHQNKSVLIEEIFPPKDYISSLNSIAQADKQKGGVEVYR